MNVTDPVDSAGAGPTDRRLRSSNMDQLILRNNRGMRHFDENDWTIAGWQYRRAPNDTAKHGEDGNQKDVSMTDRIIGVGYVGALVVFMLVYLT